MFKAATVPLDWMMPWVVDFCRLEINSSAAMRFLLSWSTLLASLLPTTLVHAQSLQGSSTCAAPAPGDYLIVGEGHRAEQPLGRLQLETWLPNGSVLGKRFLRVGRIYSETDYAGRWELDAGCGLTVTRDAAGSTSKVLLTAQGKPRFGLSDRAGDVVTERWIPQPERRCEPEDMDGTLLSVQTGHTMTASSWRPNAVIQKESWTGWSMVGLAVSSYDGAGEVAAYQGQFTQDQNCIGRIRQQDDRGVIYAYAAILRSDGGGYAYLQTQGDDLTVALVEKLGSPPLAAVDPTSLNP
jgi:hypothetical protein